jgi:hypothetical protein
MSDQTRESLIKQVAPEKALHESRSPQPDVGHNATLPPDYGHNFSRIPVYPQRQAIEEGVQPSETATSTKQGSPGTSLVNSVVSSEGQPLDSGIRDWAGPRLGHDFSQVRVHTDSQASESAQAVGALAYTVGRHIVFGSGRYQPETLPGQHTLLHELTHVAQQNDAVSALPTLGQPDQLEISNPGDAAEYEADHVSRELLATGGSQQGHISPAPIHPLKTLRLQRITRPLEDWGEHRGSKIEVKNPVVKFFVKGTNVFTPSGTQPFEGVSPLPERVSIPLNDKGHLQFFADVHVESAGYVIAATKDAKIAGLWEITNSGGRVSIEGGIQIIKDDDSLLYPKTWRLRVNDEQNEEGHRLRINIILEDIATTTIKKEASELKLGAEAKAEFEPKVEGEVKGVKVGVSAGSAGVKGSTELKIPLGKTTETTIPGQKEVIPLLIDLQPVMAPPKPEQPEYEDLPLLFFQTGSHKLEISAKEGRVPGMGEAEFVSYLNDLRERSEGRTGKNLEFIIEAQASPVGKKGQTTEQASEFNKALSKQRGATVREIVRSILPDTIVKDPIPLGSSKAIARGAAPLSNEQKDRSVRITLHRIKPPKQL